ncbi:MAG: rhodanese-like domain-containing protein [Desulfobacteraceae bacterium]|nr:rhodanese-like domain-containing protein [Desulfobacteraceae bacterium]
MKNGKTLWTALLALVFAAGALWFANRAAAPDGTSWEAILAETKDGGYRLITTEELAERYRRDVKSVLLVDTRQDWEYRAGHIEGAVNFPMEPTRWSRWRKASALEAFLGPDRERAIVFY